MPADSSTTATVGILATLIYAIAQIAQVFKPRAEKTYLLSERASKTIDEELKGIKAELQGIKRTLNEQSETLKALVEYHIRRAMKK